MPKTTPLSKTRFRNSLAVTIAALGLAAAPVAPVLAQTAADPAAEPTAQSDAQSDAASNAPAQAPTQAPTQATASFSQDQLEHFVDAAMDVAQVRDTYLPRIEAAGSDTEVQQLQKQAQSEMVQAVETTDGMDVETYTRIGQSAQNDPELGQKISMLIRERMPAAQGQAPAQSQDGTVPNSAPNSDG